MKTFEEIIQQCEKDLRSGNAQNIQTRFNALNPSKIPREFQLPLANIARRAGLFLFGLKVLNGSVRTRLDATAPELAEYAVLLQKIGAVEEAAEVLNQVDKDAAPMAHLYQAFQCFHEWDGAGAIPHSESFLKADISEYERAVGRINLAAALLQAYELKKAELILREDIEQNHQRGYVRLECNGYELLTQALIQQSEFVAAKVMIDKAHALLANEESPDIYFVHKWRAIIEAHERQTIEPLQLVRADALKRQDWEIVRDADLFICKFEFSNRIFEKLYFGTPYSHYRRRIIKTLGVSDPDADRLYRYSGDMEQPEVTFNLAKGELIKNIERRSVVEPGSKIHQMITALLLDLYRPLRVAGIFAVVFPDEMFDPFESPDRIHRLIARARKAFKESEVPLEIASHHDAYSIKITGSISIELNRDRQLTERNGVLFNKLLANFGNEGFSPKQAIEVLGVSSSTFKRLAAWAIRSRKLEKIGAGSVVVYRFT